MSEYLAVLDHRGNQIKVVNSNDVKEKDWAASWKKGIELNMLQANSNVTQPMRQSYLIYTCVNLISDTAPKAPLNFYRGPDPIPIDHPLRRLFMKPRRDMSYYELISTTAMFYSLYGEAFWYPTESLAQRSGVSKMPAEIIVIDPRGMREVIDQETKSLKGWLFNNTISLRPDEVIHFKSNNPYNPYRGLSPLDAVSFEIKGDYKASEFQEKFFENGAVPGFVLTTDKEDNTPDSELRKYSALWDQQHKGVSKSHKTAVLRGGMDFKVVGLTQKEMSFIESRVMTREIICETFRVPKTIFGATENINRATAEVQERIFWEIAIQPLLLRIQYKLNSEFISMIDPTVTARFDFTKIPVLQNIYKEDIESAWYLFQMGFSRNEINERFDLGFLNDTDYGDRKRFPMNLMNVEDEGIQYEESPIDNNMKSFDGETKFVSKDIKKERILKNFLRQHKNLEQKFKKKIQNHFFLQMKKVLQLLTKEEKSLESEMIVQRINVLDEENKVLMKTITPFYKEIIEAGQQFALDNLGLERSLQLDEALLVQRVNKITGINTTVWNQVKMNIHDGITNGDTIDQIAESIKDTYSMAKKRSILIARTEVTAAMNAASLGEYEKEGVAKVEWLTAKDEHVRESHVANGSVGPLPINSTFPSGEKYPGQSSPNCRCTLSPVVT
jgi:HK97 family phage portal protein